MSLGHQESWVVGVVAKIKLQQNREDPHSPGIWLHQEIIVIIRSLVSGDN